MAKLISTAANSKQYFPLEIQRKTCFAPFEKLGGHGRYDMIIRVRGGGIEAQAIAIRLGLARALVQNDENLRHDFKDTWIFDTRFT